MTSLASQTNATNNITAAEFAEAAGYIANAQRILLLTHLHPDGDAIGSMCGLANALQARGKTVFCAVDGGAPDHLQFLPGGLGVRSDLAGLEAIDLVIATDCADERRMGLVGKAARAFNTPLVNLDHHRTNTRYGTVNLIDASTAAAAEGVLDLLDQLGWALSADVAQCLLCGIITDTLCFRTDSTTPAVLIKAQRLMSAGGNLAEIVQRTVSRKATAAIRLWGLVMPTVKIEDHVAWVKITHEANLQAGTDGNSGDLVDLLLQADDAYIACVIYEREKGIVSVSMRAAADFDVSAVAVSLGGGGHKMAAGAEVATSIDALEARLVPMLKAAAQAGKPLYKR
jgi:bifunctional oligoribonuclease and PAP phosphatase NrnA